MYIPKGEDPNKEKRRNTGIKLRLRLAIYGVMIVYVVTGNETAKDVQWFIGSKKPMLHDEYLSVWTVKHEVTEEWSGQKK